MPSMNTDVMSEAYFEDVNNYWTNWVDGNEGPIVEEEMDDQIFYDDLNNLNVKNEMERKKIERIERMEKIRIEVEKMKGESKLNQET